MPEWFAILNGRTTPAAVPTTGDYSFPMISGTLGTGQVLGTSTTYPMKVSNAVNATQWDHTPGLCGTSGGIQEVPTGTDASGAGISDLKMKRAMAEITEMASGMVTDIGGSGETLNRLEEMVSEERHKAAGRVRVAVDSLDLRDVHIREAEHDQRSLLPTRPAS